MIRQFAVSFVVVTALTVGLGSPAGISSSASSPGSILFVRGQFPQEQVWSIRTDGSDGHALTTGPLSNVSPSPSPDGTQIAFAHLSVPWSLYLMDSSGGRKHRLSPASVDRVTWLAWSPKEDRIAFAGSVLGRGSGIFTIGANGRGLQTVWIESKTRVVNRDAYAPAWSPDGRKITFSEVRWQTSATSQRITNRLWIVGSDGTGPHVLTTLGRVVLHKNVGPFFNLTASWSPDGTHLAAAVVTKTGSDIYLLDPDGSRVRNLTGTPGYNAFPAWSPDGSQIVFSSTRNGGVHLYTMNAEGSRPTQITHDTQGDFNPVWAATG